MYVTNNTLMTRKLNSLEVVETLAARYEKFGWMIA